MIENIIYQQVRLSDDDLKTLKNMFRKHFLISDKLWIFGSRANLKQKGGDIDIYIETTAKTIDDSIKMKSDFIWDLEQEIGEQKIDVVLNMLNFPHPLTIHRIAKEEGVRIL